MLSQLHFRFMSPFCCFMTFASGWSGKVEWLSISIVLPLQAQELNCKNCLNKQKQTTTTANSWPKANRKNNWNECSQKYEEIYFRPFAIAGGAMLAVGGGVAVRYICSLQIQTVQRTQIENFSQSGATNDFCGFSQFIGLNHLTDSWSMRAFSKLGT